MERQLQLTNWGPLLDHGVGFNFDCYYHYLYSGDLEACESPIRACSGLLSTLESIVGTDGLLPVENLGTPSVWIDHIAYQQQRHKQCAFNLYAAAMLQNALAFLCDAFGDRLRAQAARDFGRRLSGGHGAALLEPGPESSSSIISPGSGPKARRACVTALWPRRSCLINVLMGAWRRPAGAR